MILKWFTEFFDDLKRVRGRTRNTILAYRRDLDFWSGYLETTKSPSAKGFIEFLQRQGLSERSLSRTVSSVRTYLKFCELKGDPPSAILLELRPPQAPIKSPSPLLPAEFQKLLVASLVLDSEARTKRNALVLRVLFETGVRATELISLKVQSLNIRECKLAVFSPSMKSQRALSISETLCKELVDYTVSLRPKLVKDGLPLPESLFINDKSHPLTRIDLWRWLKAWSQKAGFLTPIHPHQFRHGYALKRMTGGASLQDLKTELGHSSLQTTRMYSAFRLRELDWEEDGSSQPELETDGVN